MNVLILSDYSRIASDMNAKLRLYGFNSVLLTTKHIDRQQTVINVSLFRSKRLVTFLDHVRAYVYRRLLLRSRGLYFQDIAEDGAYYRIDRIRRKVPFKPDLVIVLFDYRMITARTILDIHRWSGARILWFMVDMKPMTGGCAYSGPCMKYTVGCPACPLIGNRLFRNYAQRTVEMRKTLLAEVDLKLVAGSTFQYEQARSSYLFRDREIKRIFFPNDELVFKCEGRNRARERLSLPPEARIILFGAQRFDVEIKGYKFILEALNRLGGSIAGMDVLLLTVGNGILPPAIEKTYPIRKLGWVDYETLSLAYQAADVFVSPSIEDSGPMMVNQSLMCGTPVVAFKMGVSIDLVTNGKTGFLAELGDSAALARGVQEILMLSLEDKDKVNAECLKVAEELNYRAFVGNLRALLA